MKKLATLAIVLLATACSSKATDTSVGGNTGDGGPGSGGSSGSSGSSGGDPGTPTGPVKIGSVTLSQTSFTAGATTINSYSASAFFIETAGGTATGTTGAKCTQSVEGDCSISECDVPMGSGDAGSPVDAGTPAQPVTPPTAGDITVAAAKTITLAADAAKGSYAPMSGQEQLFAPDSDIKITAKGAEVAAFDKTLKAPSAITITEPAWPAAGQPLQIDRTKEIALVWTGGVSGDITATVSSISSAKIASMVCKFPANANKGTIPAAALGKLVVTSSGSISISGSSTVTFDDGDWKITASATSPAKAGTSLAAGSANVK